MLPPSGDTRRALGTPYIVWIAALMATSLMLVLAAAAQAAPFQNEMDRAPIVTDEPVNAIEEVGGRIVIGGNFSHVGRRVGSAVNFSTRTGLQRLGFPDVVGGVEVVIPDGKGGWYLGGSFTRVGGQPRRGLAHVLASNQVDPAFHPTVDPLYYSVMALGLVGNTLYLGGNFISVNGTNQPHAAAVDATTGELKTWNPDSRSTVWSIKPTSSGILVGGYFPQDAAHLIKADPVTGANLGWSDLGRDWVYD
ncbi:MAG: hypothetical protein ACRDKE_12935, partial [Solirubrobacterales bacterium]